MKLYLPNHRRWLAEYAEKLLWEKEARNLDAAIRQTFVQYPDWDTLAYRSTISADILKVQGERRARLARAKERRLAKELEASQPKKSKKSRRPFQKIRNAFKRTRTEQPDIPAFVISEEMRKEAEKLAASDPDN